MSSRIACCAGVEACQRVRDAPVGPQRPTGQQRRRRAWPLKRTKRLKFWLPTMPRYSAKKAMSEPNGIAVYSCAVRQQPRCA